MKENRQSRALLPSEELIRIRDKNPWIEKKKQIFPEAKLKNKSEKT